VLPAKLHNDRAAIDRARRGAVEVSRLGDVLSRAGTAAGGTAARCMAHGDWLDRAVERAMGSRWFWPSIAMVVAAIVYVGSR
jgi:hypothetical protein